VDVAVDELFADLGGTESEDVGERGTGTVLERGGGEDSERGGAWASDPACEHRAGMRMGGPPDGRHLSKAEEEAEIFDWPGRERLPEWFAKTERDAEDVPHTELGRRIEDGVGARFYDERSLLEDTKRDGHDGSPGGYGVGIGCRFDVAGTPAEMANRGVKMDRSGVVADAICEVFGQLIVATQK